MKTALIETIPKNTGDQLSWLSFKFGKVRKPSNLGGKLKLTVDLTDIITNFWSAAKGIDPESQINILSQKGFLTPDFKIQIIGKDFEIEAEKVLAGGANSEILQNYKIWVNLYAKDSERMKQLMESYKLFGPIPEYSFTNE